MSNYVRRGRYLVARNSSNAPRSSSGVEVISGRGGSTVFRVGSNFAQPAEAPDEDKAGTAELIAELHRQKRARESN